MQRNNYRNTGALGEKRTLIKMFSAKFVTSPVQIASAQCQMLISEKNDNFHETIPCQIQHADEGLRQEKIEGSLEEDISFVDRWSVEWAFTDEGKVLQPIVW